MADDIPEPPLIDAPRHADLLAALGGERLRALVTMLGDELAALPGLHDAAFAARVHRLRGSAGSLGFPALAAALLALETAIVAGSVAHIDTALARLPVLHAAVVAALPGGDHVAGARKL